MLTAALAGHTQLTRLELDIAAAEGLLTCLPTSLVEAQLVVRFEAEACASGPVSVCFQHLPALRSLSVRLLGGSGFELDQQSDDGHSLHEWPRFVVAVPSKLTQLRVAGDVGDLVCCDQQQQQQQQQQEACFDELQVFELLNPMAMLPLQRLAQLVAGMPRLREFCLDGASRHPRRQAWNAEMSLLDTQALFAALSAATQLTGLSVRGFGYACGGGIGVFEEEGEEEGEEEDWEDAADGFLGDQLRRLTGLRSLDLDLPLQGVEDARGVVSLTQLTSLQLRVCGLAVQEQEVQELCAGGRLLQLRELILNETRVEDCEALFGAVAQLTNLESLNVWRNHWLNVLPQHLQLLTPLVRLRQLRLPGSAYNTCVDSGGLSELLVRLPRLGTVWAGANEFNRGGQVPPRRLFRVRHAYAWD
jgi:hypothetical protein